MGAFIATESIHRPFENERHMFLFDQRNACTSSTSLWPTTATSAPTKSSSHSTPITRFRGFLKALLSCHSCLVMNYIAINRYAHNPKVGGSNPSPATNPFNRLDGFISFYPTELLTPDPVSTTMRTAILDVKCWNGPFDLERRQPFLRWRLARSRKSCVDRETLCPSAQLGPRW